MIAAPLTGRPSSSLMVPATRMTCAWACEMPIRTRSAAAKVCLLATIGKV
jgi:hypothetical protein